MVGINKANLWEIFQKSIKLSSISPYDCHDKIPCTRWLKHYFLIILKARIPRSSFSQAWFQVRSLFLAGRWLPSWLCPHVESVLSIYARDISGVFSYKGLFWIRAWPLWCHLSLITLKTLSPNIVTLGV